MKALLCVMDSMGLAMQMIGVAREILAGGHELACVANPSFAALCQSHGIRWIERDSDRNSFTLRSWTAPHATLGQFRYLRTAIKGFAPDVLVASPFGFGPALAAEVTRLPLVVLGGATFAWAAGTPRREESLGMFDGARVALGLPKIGGAGLVGHPPWLGDTFLLQSAPRLSGPVRCSDRVRWVGDCTWDPPTPPDPDLAAWLGAVERTGRRLIYAQCGREFGDTPVDDRLFEAATRLDLAIAIDTGRSDQPRTLTSERVFARPFIPRGQVMPRSVLVLGSGQPTTVLGALAQRLPMVLLAHGSGTEETAAACAEACVARTSSLAQVTASALEGLISDAIDSAAMRMAVAAIAEELAQLGGPRRAAELIVEASARRPRGSPASAPHESTRASGSLG